ncbi:hypothetical protein ACLMJK_005531 [Lecanora helva]
MGSGREEDEFSESDHQYKRRKTTHMRQPNLNGTAKENAGASPAAPNSFAARMMAKMGYVEGQGLGATGKGRLAPIETQQRPQGAGLGAVKEKTKQAKDEEKREAAFRGEALEDSSEEERKRKRKLKEKRISGVKSGGGTPVAKPKAKYRTVKEMEAAAEGLEVPNVLKSIIDATGQETKVLASTAGLMSSGVAMVPSETEPEKIARRARRDLEAFTEEWRALKEREDFFDSERTQIQVEIEKEEQGVRRIAELVSTVQQTNLDSDDSSEMSAWEEITTKLEALERSAKDEEGFLELQEVAVAAIHPHFKAAMEEWDPLHQPSSISEYLYKLQHILGIRSQSSNTEIALQNGISYTKPPSKSTTPYETMIHKYWLPRVRSTITNDWDVYNPDPLLDLIKIWEPVLPSFIFANVIDQLIVRRLTDAVSSWKPRNLHKHRRHTQPQAWLFPWLQYLDEQHTNPKSTTGLLADVKRKLKTVLSTWDLSTGLFPGLESWSQIYPTDLTPLLIRHLLPRLSLYLSENLNIDPSDQDLTPLEKVLEWKPYFSPATMAQLFVAEFFHKWHETLYIWLTSKEANFEEISQWYQWWKETLETEASDPRRETGFNEVPEIAAEWTKGVDAINRAIDALENGVSISDHLSPPTTAPASLPVSTPTPITTTISSPKPPVLDTPTTFKDVVEDWCSENDLHLIPLREADLSTGAPLFRITASANGRGGVVVYLRGDVVWARSGGGGGGGDGKKVFMPVELSEGLVGRAEGR